jgi:hypothetical protein
MEVNGEVRVTILEDQSLMRESLKEVLEHGGLHVVGQYGDPGEFLQIGPHGVGAKRAVDAYRKRPRMQHRCGEKRPDRHLLLKPDPRKGPEALKGEAEKEDV